MRVTRGGQAAAGRRAGQGCVSAVADEPQGSQAHWVPDCCAQDTATPVKASCASQ